MRGKKRRKNRRRVSTLNKIKDLGIIISIIVTISIMSLGILKIVNVNIGVNKKPNEIASSYDNNINMVINSSEVKSENESDKNIEVVNDNKINYLSLDEDINADDAKGIQGMLNNWDYGRDDDKKVVYLTFDDGPSKQVTSKILDILEINNVKATFFILGKMIEDNAYAKENLMRMAEEGHAIGNHGYSHKYDMLYPDGVVNVNEFMADIKKTEQMIQAILGEEFHTRVLRFPGGHSSWNTEAIDDVLEEEGYVYIDWNTLNGDAEWQDNSAQSLLDRLIETIDDLEGNNDTLVILMHDTDLKESTAEYLQQAIEYLKALGYEFKTIK